MVRGGEVLADFVDLAGQDRRLTGGLSVDGAILDRHVHFRRAHGRRRSAERLNDVSRCFRVRTDLQALEILRLFDLFGVVAELYIAIVSPDQRMNALLFHFCRQLRAQISIECIVSRFDGRQDERQIEDLECRYDHGPACGRVQTDIQPAAHERIIHILVIVELSGRVYLDLDRSLGSFIDLFGKFFYTLGQMMLGRQLICQLQLDLLPIAGCCRLLISAGHAASRHHTCHCQSSQRSGCDLHRFLTHHRSPFLLYLHQPIKHPS